MAPNFYSPELYRRLVPTRVGLGIPSRVVRQAPATVTVTSAPSGGDGGTTTLSGGAIAGIVIGSIAGFLLLLWIFRSCTNLGAPPQEREKPWYNDVEPRHSSSHHHRRGSHHSHQSRGEIRAVSPVPVIREDRRRSRDHPSRSPRRPEEVYVYDSGRGKSAKRYYGSG